MFVHSVYFWLLPSTGEPERIAFTKALRGLLSIASVGQGFIGPPAATRDQVIEHGYSYALTLLFADQAAHDRYQVDPLHEKFVADFLPFFAQVRVFDSQCDNESLECA